LDRPTPGEGDLEQPEELPDVMNDGLDHCADAMIKSANKSQVAIV
jgi:type III secretion system FlhB-like substrate exporter